MATLNMLEMRSEQWIKQMHLVLGSSRLHLRLGRASQERAAADQIIMQRILRRMVLAEIPVKPVTRKTHDQTLIKADTGQGKILGMTTTRKMAVRGHTVTIVDLALITKMIGMTATRRIHGMGRGRTMGRTGTLAAPGLHRCLTRVKVGVGALLKIQFVLV